MLTSLLFCFLPLCVTSFDSTLHHNHCQEIYVQLKLCSFDVNPSNAQVLERSGLDIHHVLCIQRPTSP